MSGECETSGTVTLNLLNPPADCSSTLRTLFFTDPLQLHRIENCCTKMISARPFVCVSGFRKTLFLVVG